MAHSSRGAFATAGAPRGFDIAADDSDPAASVLKDIMPVLARIQARSPHAPISGLSAMAPAETVAAIAFVADLGGDSLRRLTAYLDEEAEGHAGLEHCVPLAAAAAQALAARDYAQAFTMIFDCYRTIAMLRVADPNLPLPSSIKAILPEGRGGENRLTGEGDGRDAPSGPPH